MAGTSTTVPEKPHKACPMVLHASDVTQGLALEKFLKNCFAKIVELQPKCSMLTGDFPEKLVWGSGCTGSGTDVWIAKELQTALEKNNVLTEFGHAFLIENNSQKQMFLLKAVLSQDKKGSQCCMHGDIAEAKDAFAQCSQHRRRCRVKRPDVLIIGFSCKGASRQNGTNKYRKTCLVHPGGGSTYITYNSLLALVDRHKPDFIFFENSDAMTDVDETSSVSL